MTDLQPSDNQLLSDAKSGDPQAFAELCRRHSGILRQRIFSIVRHREDTEDVLQDTFLNAYQHLHSFRAECKFSTWIVRIGINTSLALLRKRKRLSKATSDVVKEGAPSLQTWDVRDPMPNPEQQSMSSQARKMLGLAIQRLPSQFRSIMLLYLERERTICDAAETLGITQAAAKARMHRARNLLRHSLNRPVEVTSNSPRGRRQNYSSA